MGEVEFNKDDEYKVKIVDGGEYKEPGGGIRKPSQEEIDEYKIHRVVVMVIFGLVVAILLLLIVILIATTDDCEVTVEKKLPWYKSGVVYNIYPRSFKDSNGDGIGDFKGIIDKLSYLKGLGVNILYLSSVFKIDKSEDYGYAVIDFKDTNPEYGSLEDFKKLVDSAHGENMKVIVEFLPVDTSIQHEWFKQSSERKNKTDWYVWNENVNKTKTDDKWLEYENSGRYYLCSKGYEKRATLNWDNGDVQAEMQSVLDFWLSKGVDGFRVVSVQKLFGDNATTSDWEKIHMIVEKWQNYTTKINQNSILIGSSHPANLELYGTEECLELDVVVNFDLVYGSHAGSVSNFYTAAKFKDIITKYIEKLSEGNWPSWALTSWVHGRVGSNIDAKLARSLQALLVTLPGTPIAFYGDEFGMNNVNNSGPAVDMNKAPMQWDGSKNGGFTTGNSTWFGAVGNFTYANAEDDQLGIEKVFKAAVKLRTDNAKVLLDGPLANFTVVSKGNVLAYTFEDKLPRFAGVINFGDAEDEINLKNLLSITKATLKYHSADKKPSEVKTDALKVPAKELYIFQVTGRVKK